MVRSGLAITVLAVLFVMACNRQPAGVTESDGHEAPRPQAPVSSTAPPPLSFGGFDGARAYEHVRHLVELGPRPPDSDAIRRAQSYIISQLKSYGCQVEEHDFHGSTPIGYLAMKNIVAKFTGTGSGIVLYATHYDTLRMPNFVGAVDGGSGTGPMLELARLFCSRKRKLNTWIVFFDGEEAQGHWSNRDSVQWSIALLSFSRTTLAAPQHDDASMNNRGDHVMGSSRTKTTHHFELTKTGGIIQVTANDPADSASRNLIRMHLQHISKSFAAGDFEDPMEVHAEVPPGVPVMKEAKSKIEYRYESIARGGRVVIQTNDSNALEAVHE